MNKQYSLLIITLCACLIPSLAYARKPTKRLDPGIRSERKSATIQRANEAEKARRTKIVNQTIATLQEKPNTIGAHLGHLFGAYCTIVSPQAPGKAPEENLKVRELLQFIVSHEARNLHSATDILDKLTQMPELYAAMKPAIDALRTFAYLGKWMPDRTPESITKEEALELIEEYKRDNNPQLLHNLTVLAAQLRRLNIKKELDDAMRELATRAQAQPTIAQAPQAGPPAAVAQALPEDDVVDYLAQLGAPANRAPAARVEDADVPLVEFQNIASRPASAATQAVMPRHSLIPGPEVNQGDARISAEAKRLAFFAAQKAATDAAKAANPVAEPEPAPAPEEHDNPDVNADQADAVAQEELEAVAGGKNAHPAQQGPEEGEAPLIDRRQIRQNNHEIIRDIWQRASRNGGLCLQLIREVNVAENFFKNAKINRDIVTLEELHGWMQATTERVLQHDTTLTQEERVEVLAIQQKWNPAAAASRHADEQDAVPAPPIQQEDATPAENPAAAPPAPEEERGGEGRDVENVDGEEPAQEGADLDGEAPAPEEENARPVSLFRRILRHFGFVTRIGATIARPVTAVARAAQTAAIATFRVITRRKAETAPAPAQVPAPAEAAPVEGEAPAEQGLARRVLALLLFWRR